MNDSTTAHTHQYYLEDSDDWTVIEEYHFSCIPDRPRHPHFSYQMWLRYSYKNFKLLIQRVKEFEYNQGIQRPKWLQRSKNSFV